MKKALRLCSLLMLLVLCLTLSGCQRISYDIEDHKWQFSLVVSNTNGKVLYCAQDRLTMHPDTAVLDLQCTVKGGTLTLKTAKNIWQLPYTLSEEGPDGRIYQLGTEGTALASVEHTTFNDGSGQHTLTLAIDQYTLYFRD